MKFVLLFLILLGFIRKPMGFKSSRHNPKLAKDRVCCLALHGKLEGPAGAWLLGKALKAV